MPSPPPQTARSRKVGVACGRSCLVAPLLALANPPPILASSSALFGERVGLILLGVGVAIAIAAGWWSVRVRRLAAERLAASEARLAQQALHDPLTGLPNRAHFLERLEQALARARRAGRPCAILALDRDRFKQINDTLGHAAGDALLVATATRLQGCLREEGTLARLGGGEFALLLEGVADLAEVARVAERLLAALAAPLALPGRELIVTASIGTALSTGPQDTATGLLRSAEVALSRARGDGYARYEAFSPGMNAGALDRLELEHDLRLALRGDEIRVYYQPKVELATGRIVALEALVRWQHPTRGLIPPGEFVALAEETGLIVPLGRRVLAEACRRLGEWRACHPAPETLELAVNLSPRQFRHRDLVADIAAALAAAHVPPDRLVLELTETTAMEQPTAAIATVRELKALGVRLALDDFGTGHSSLAYLQRLPLDMLKIDRTFFADTAKNCAIVGTVTDLAHDLGLVVTAEGLETVEQVAWACAAGCDRGQGYYFARPLAPDELDTLCAGGLAFDMPTTVLTA